MMVDLPNPISIPVEGVELNLVEMGTGQPLVLIHGSLGDYRTWMPQMEPLSRHFRTLAYSRRYHYPNAWSGDGRDYTVKRHAEDLIGLIEALQLGPVNAAGNSFGAYTTLVAATLRPDLFRKLVIGEPPILPWLKAIPGGHAYWDGFMQTTWEPARQTFESGDLEGGVALFVDGVSGPGSFATIPEPAKARMMQNARSLMAETLSPGYFTELTPGQIQSIPAPILLLKGERSPRMFHLIVDRLAETARNCRLETIPHASHSMPSNNPPAYNQVVLDFLVEE